MAEVRTDRAAVQQAIAEHLATRGPIAWDEVRARYPEVPVATFWRWVRAAKAKPSPAQLVAAREVLAGIQGAAVARAAPVPAPIAIGAIAAAGAEATRHVHFLRAFDELMADADLLRSFALNDQRQVGSPKIFVDAAKMKIQLLQMWLSAIPVLYSAERTERFYASMIDTIASCEPEVAKAITVRLRVLSEQAGYVVSG